MRRNKIKNIKLREIQQKTRALIERIKKTRLNWFDYEMCRRQTTVQSSALHCGWTTSKRKTSESMDRRRQGRFQSDEVRRQRSRELSER